MVHRETGLLDTDGEQIGYDVVTPDDAAATVVLVHGSGGNRASWWSLVPQLAGAGLRVVAPDLRGAGRSTDRADAAGPRSGARDLDALRRHLGVDRWDVVGHSAGGWPALRHAAEAPDAVDGVHLAGSVAGVFPPAVDAWWHEMLASLATTPWRGHTELGRTPSLSDDYCDSRPDGAYLYQLIAALNPPPSPTGAGMRVRDADLTPAEIGAIAAPVRFVSGALDEAIPPQAVRAAAAAVPGATWDELPGVGHLPWWEDPAGFTDWLLAGIRRTPR